MRKTIKLLDLSAQALLLAAISVSIIGGVATREYAQIFWALVLAFPLGLWQLFSAIITGVAYKSGEHLLYAFGAISYCILAIGLIYISDQLTAPAPIENIHTPYLWILFWLAPAVGAFWYLNRSFKDYQNS